MRRREFITLLGGAAAAWPLAAHAQQPDRMQRIGMLIGSAEDDPEMKSRLASFGRGLSDADGRRAAMSALTLALRRVALNVMGRSRKNWSISDPM